MARPQNDVYFQVGLLTTIGLSAKNAILIVEFAKEQHEHGKDLVEAALTAARMRLRPILMTSLAFILGVLPLALASGAGAGGQNAIGIAVIGGMALGHRARRPLRPGLLRADRAPRPGTAAGSRSRPPNAAMPLSEES